MIDRKKVILYTCCMSLFVVTMDVTVVNVALPSIQSDFHTNLSTLQWVTDGYTLMVASLLLLSGSTADRIGRKRVLQLGLACFGLASFLCGISQTPGQLIAFRMLQGIGGSMLNPVAMSIITQVFTEKLERAKAIGLWGSVTGISLGMGPIIGGLIVAYFSWRYVFFVNVPIIAAAIILTQKFVPESKVEKTAKNDFVGQALMILFLFSSIYSIIGLPRKGLFAPDILSTGIIGCLAIVIFFIYEYNIDNPLINPRFFLSIPFTSASFLAIFGFIIYNGYLFLNTLYLQEMRGFSPLEAGLSTIPLAFVSFLVAPRAGEMVGRIGTKRPIMLCGISMLAVSFLQLFVTKTTPMIILFIIYIFLGIGFGMLNSPITITAIEGMPLSQSGTAAAIAVTCKQIGNSLGVALPSLLITKPITSSLTRTPFTNVWLLFGCCAIAIIFLSYLSNSPLAKKSLRRVRFYF